MSTFRQIITSTSFRQITRDRVAELVCVLLNKRIEAYEDVRHLITKLIAELDVEFVGGLSFEEAYERYFPLYTPESHASLGFSM